DRGEEVEHADGHFGETLLVDGALYRVPDGLLGIAVGFHPTCRAEGLLHLRLRTDQKKVHHVALRAFFGLHALREAREHLLERELRRGARLLLGLGGTGHRPPGQKAKAQDQGEDASAGHTHTNILSRSEAGAGRPNYSRRGLWLIA